MKMNTSLIKKGFTDSPAVKDEFNIQRYIGGLSSFIEKCNTPMTIAIQGDWGTGKTSIMSMIKKELENKDDIHLVWFNTWQFSQFNMGDSLSLLMMNKLINSIGDGSGDAKNTIKNLVGGLASIAVGYASGGTVNMKEMFSTDFMDQFENLKRDFQNLVNRKAGANGRVVIFIDDLDRLQPGRAVELLEVLKIFLDCEKCVFVLAIDYNVVSRGVKEKYGEDFGDEKGKSFFDKIIQVPFKMPVAEYDISNYVRVCFSEIGIEIKDDESLQSYVKLVNHSVGNNPRSMKRLFNSYLLLNNIATDEVIQSDKNRQILFAILCLQSKFESMYNYIVSKRNSLTIEDLNNLAETDNPVFTEYKMSENEMKQFIMFFGDFIDLIDKDSKDGISKEEFDSFKNVLSFSTITASSSSETIEEEDWRTYRYKHRDLCRKLGKILSDKFGLKFLEYYRKTQEKGSWWIYIRNESYIDNESEKNVRFGFEFRLDPDYEEKSSTMTLNIYKIDPTSLEEVIALIGDNPFESIGLTAKVEDHCITYECVKRFETDSQVEEIEDIVMESFDVIKEYFID